MHSSTPGVEELEILNDVDILFGRELTSGISVGDILADEAPVLAGSLGMLPSASIGSGSFGAYEPIHGSAPDIEEHGVVNPVATILSAAMLLRHSLGRDDAATGIERAVELALRRGLRTADIASRISTPSTTDDFTLAVVMNLTA